MPNIADFRNRDDYLRALTEHSLEGWNSCARIAIRDTVPVALARKLGQGTAKDMFIWICDFYQSELLPALFCMDLLLHFHWLREATIAIISLLLLYIHAPIIYLAVFTTFSGHRGRGRHSSRHFWLWLRTRVSSTWFKSALKQQTELKSASLLPSISKLPYYTRQSWCIGGIRNAISTAELKEMFSKITSTNPPTPGASPVHSNATTIVAQVIKKLQEPRTGLDTDDSADKIVSIINALATAKLKETATPFGSSRTRLCRPKSQSPARSSAHDHRPASSTDNGEKQTLECALGVARIAATGHLARMRPVLDCASFQSQINAMTTPASTERLAAFDGQLSVSPSAVLCVALEDTGTVTTAPEPPALATTGGALTFHDSNDNASNDNRPSALIVWLRGRPAETEISRLKNEMNALKANPDRIDPDAGPNSQLPDLQAKANRAQELETEESRLDDQVTALQAKANEFDALQSANSKLEKEVSPLQAASVAAS
ncbi:hypothetical protein IWZ00DRAFT_494089 [Phyllosticta capitalensis]